MHSAHDTRNKENFLISRGTDNTVRMSARVWNALVTKININVTLPVKKKMSVEMKYSDKTENINYRLACYVY